MSHTTSDRWRGYGLAIGAHVLVVLIWHFWVELWDVPRYIMPTPLATIMTITEDYGWWYNTWITTQEVFLGYFMALVAGIGLALIFSWWRLLNQAFMPLIVSLNMIPKVALGPLFIVWFSYGVMSNAVIAFAICFLPIMLTTERGLREVEPELLDLVRSLKGSRWQIFAKIQFPGALPHVFSGMKVAAVLAVAGAIVGEFIASDRGLGYLMLQVQVSMDTPAMFMAVLMITLVGVALYSLVLLLERILVVGGRES